MISFNKASAKHNDPEKEARLAGIRQISDWVESELPEDEQETTSVMVNQIECKEEGCPPVECVIALLRKPKLVFKIFKRVVDVTQPEVVAALKEALAKEAAELKAEHAGHAEHGHAEHGHAEGGEHGHEHEGGCCGHDHDQADKKGRETEHGHAEHGHAEHAHGHATRGDAEHGHAEGGEHGHEHAGGCCGHDHEHADKTAEAEHAHGHGHQG